MAPLIPNLGARGKYVANAIPRPLHPRGRAPVPVVEDAGWVPRLVLMGIDKMLASTWVQTPDRLPRSESLYRLSYRSHRTGI
jgi:hypothetical protein